jgi:hypothetical protein
MMKRISMALVMVPVAGLVLGCSAAPPVASFPADFTGPGTFIVSGPPTAEFAISSVRFVQAHGMATLSYELPAELVGDSPSIEMTGALPATGPLQLDGIGCTSTCTILGSLECYQDLYCIYPVAPASDQTPAQHAASLAFASNPIGVLNVVAPP